MNRPQDDNQTVKSTEALTFYHWNFSGIKYLFRFLSLAHTYKHSRHNIFCKRFADYVCGFPANVVSLQDIPLINQFKTSGRAAMLCSFTWNKRQQRRHWQTRHLPKGAWYWDSLVADLKVEDELASEMSSQWHQPTLKCRYQASVCFQFSKFWTLALSVAQDRLINCLEARPHFQTLCVAFHLQRETINPEYLLTVCKHERNSGDLFAKLFANTVCWQCLQVWTSISDLQVRLTHLYFQIPIALFLVSRLLYFWTRPSVPHITPILAKSVKGHLLLFVANLNIRKNFYRFTKIFNTAKICLCFTDRRKADICSRWDEDFKPVFLWTLFKVHCPF
jgi:hypothetical protein